MLIENPKETVMRFLFHERISYLLLKRKVLYCMEFELLHFHDHLQSKIKETISHFSMEFLLDFAFEYFSMKIILKFGSVTLFEVYR